MPGVELAWLRRLECTKISRRFRSFMKATKGLSKKVVPTFVGNSFLLLAILRLNAWIESFLDGRLQAVVVEGERSDFVPVQSVVPQGSVLGPSLFLTYISDLPAGIKSKVRLFADGTMRSKTTKKAEDQRTLQEDLDSLTTWEEQWSMEFHLQKCSTLSATRKRKIIPAYEIHGHILENVSMTKYLGVTIQDDLRWGGDPTSALPQAKPTRPSVSSGETSRSATRRQRKLRTKPLLTF